MDQVQDEISKTDTLLSDSEKKLKELTEEHTVRWFYSTFWLILYIFILNQHYAKTNKDV